MTTKPIAFSAKNGHARCLICGEQNPLSLHLDFQDDEEQGVRAHYRTNPTLQGYDGMLHGGILAALLDAAMTHCLFHLGIQAVTGELHVRFAFPVPCNAEIDISAWLLHSAPPVHYLKAEICYAGRLSAWAEAKFLPHDNPKIPSDPGEPVVRKRSCRRSSCRARFVAIDDGRS